MVQPKFYCERSAEFRSAKPNDNETGDGHLLEGYGAVFDQDTEIKSGWEGNFTERISKGAFKKTLKEKMPVVQFDHGRDSRVGSVPIAKIEELKEDSQGLFIRATMFDNATVEPVRQAIEAQAISGMSFKFRVTRDEWRDGKGKRVKPEELEDLLFGGAGERGPLKRSIKEVELAELGPVVFPAYGGTSVGVRSGEDDQPMVERDKVIAAYQRTMQLTEAERKEIEEEELREWLAAEDEYRSELQAWLDAESEFRSVTAESDKVKAKKESKDAVRENTSSNPGSPNAGRKTTLDDSKQTRGTTVPKPKDKAMTLEELRALLAELVQRATDLGEESRDGELSDEDQKDFDEVTARAEDTKARIAKIEARQAKLAELAEAGNTERGDGVVRGTPAFHKDKGDDLYDVDAIRSESHGTEDFRSRAADAAKKIVEKTHYIEGGDKVRESLTYSLDFEDSRDSELARRIMATGNPTYERAFGKLAMSGGTAWLSEAERQSVERAMAVGTNAAGNFAVPYQIDPTISHLGSGYISPIRQLSKKVQLVGKELISTTITQATVYRAAEAASVLDGSPTLAQTSVKVNGVKGFIPFSIEIDEDWNQMRSTMSELLQEAKDREEASSFMIGNGTPPNPSGLLTGATTLVSAGTGLGITAADIYKLEESLPLEFRDRAVFLGSKPVYNKVRQLAGGDASGAAMWERIGNRTPNQLLGYDCYEASFGFPASGTFTNGMKLLVFGDFSNFLIVDRVGMSIELIPMLFDSANGNRPTGQRALFAHWRNNSIVTNADAFRVLTATT